MVAAIVFGGTPIVELASIPLLAAALVRLRAASPGLEVRLALAIALALVAVPALQLIPLPPAIWTSLPGRGFVVAALVASGVEPGWMPLSLSPQSTVRTALSLLPGLAMFLACLTLSPGGRRLVSLIVIAGAAISVPLGLAQIAGGPMSPLRFFENTHFNNAVGFFANRNHYAALLYSALPFVAAWIVWSTGRRGQERLLKLTCGVVVLVCLLLGLAMSASRTGVLLAMAALAGGLALAWKGESTRTSGARRVLAAGGLVGVLIALQFGMAGLVVRFGADPLEDYRAQMFRVSLDAGKAVFPAGSGIGTFVPYYALHETPESMISTYVNQAHNDWLELWIEAGAAAAIVAAAFLVWFAVAAFNVWRNADAGLDRLLAKAATIAIALLLLHSLVDYPLRSGALMCVFAFACGLITEYRMVPLRERRPARAVSKSA